MPTPPPWWTDTQVAPDTALGQGIVYGLVQYESRVLLLDGVGPY